MPNQIPLRLFVLTKDLYTWYLRGLLVAAYLDQRDRAKAHACNLDLAQIHRHIGMRVLYLELGATSRRHKEAVQAGLDVFYDRVHRGSNLSGRVSKWQNRGRNRPIGEAATRVLAHYQLLNSETLVKLEESIYTAAADRTNDIVPVCLVLAEMNGHDLRELIELVKQVEAEEAALRTKKARKPRAPDTEETKAKKKAAAQARCARAAAARALATLPLAA